MRPGKLRDPVNRGTVNHGTVNRGTVNQGTVNRGFTVPYDLIDVVFIFLHHLVHVNCDANNLFTFL